MSTRKPRIVLFGLFGMNNLGNDATLRVTLEQIRKLVPDADVGCICGEPAKVARDFGVTTVDFDPLPIPGSHRLTSRGVTAVLYWLLLLLTEPWRRRRAARYLQDADHLIICGTGALDDFGAKPWNIPTWLMRWCSAAKRVGARLVFAGVGAGPIANPVNRYIMKRAVLKADDRSYRDTVSKEFLRNLRVDVSSDRVVPDLVFGMVSAARTAPSTRGERRLSVGVGLMGYYGWSNDPRRGSKTYETYLEGMAVFVAWLLKERRCAVRLLIGEVGTDEKAVQDLRAKLAKLGIANAVELPKIDAVDHLVAQIAQTDVVVATRYHNVVLSLALCRPVIAIGYADKFAALMADAGLADYCQAVETLDVQLLMNQFDRLIAQAPDLMDRLTERVGLYREAVADEFQRMLGNSGRG